MQLPCPRFALLPPLLFGLLLGACGTSYELPGIDSAALTEASQIIAEEKVQAAGTGKTPENEAWERYRRVVDSVEPVAEDFCKAQRPEESEKFCDFNIRVDGSVTNKPNAFQRIGSDGRPDLSMTPSFLTLARNDDEMAFVLGHEAAHQISGHLDKQSQQQTAGAAIGAILGTALVIAGAAAGADMSSTGGAIILGSGAIGAYGGRHVYSQTYELEADMLGTYITEKAGYDPVLGSRVFARLSADEGRPVPQGKASFWSTHPRSPERIAVVMATADRIEAQRKEGLIPNPGKRRQTKPN